MTNVLPEGRMFPPRRYLFPRSGLRDPSCGTLAGAPSPNGAARSPLLQAVEVSATQRPFGNFPNAHGPHAA